MSRLNKANVLAHFSHSGVDYMADNTCHFGINNFFADNGLSDNTKLYFPADALHLKSVLSKIYNQDGLRFIFTTRSPTPYILDKDGKKFYENHKFTGYDDLIREGKAGYIVTYGEMLHKCLTVVEELRKEGIDIGLINKSLLNIIDEDMIKKIGKSKFVLVVETQNIKTGLGARFGTWLLERGLSPKYAHLGTHLPGEGGLDEQIPHQGLDQESIKKKVKEML